jgi:myo-inositol-1(or 4)-monophosphatase
MFIGNRGSGALLNDRRLRINHTQGLSGALIGSAIGTRETEQLTKYVDLQKALMAAGVGLRSSGSSVLDLAFVAAGYLNGTWQQGIQAWDMAAGILMIREAGGIVTELQGGNNPMKSGNVLAGNRKVHAAMLQQLHPTPTHTGQRLRLKKS